MTIADRVVMYSTNILSKQMIDVLKLGDFNDFPVFLNISNEYETKTQCINKVALSDRDIIKGKYKAELRFRIYPQHIYIEAWLKSCNPNAKVNKYIRVSQCKYGMNTKLTAIDRMIDRYINKIKDYSNTK